MSIKSEPTDQPSTHSRSNEINVQDLWDQGFKVKGTKGDEFCLHSKASDYKASNSQRNYLEQLFNRTDGTSFKFTLQEIAGNFNRLRDFGADKLNPLEMEEFYFNYLMENFNSGNQKDRVNTEVRFLQKAEAEFITNFMAINGNTRHHRKLEFYIDTLKQKELCTNTFNRKVNRDKFPNLQSFANKFNALSHTNSPVLTPLEAAEYYRQFIKTIYAVEQRTKVDTEMKVLQKAIDDY